MPSPLEQLNALRAALALADHQRTIDMLEWEIKQLLHLHPAALRLSPNFLSA
jgi:hypothetical protein